MEYALGSNSWDIFEDVLEMMAKKPKFLTTWLRNIENHGDIFHENPPERVFLRLCRLIKMLTAPLPLETRVSLLRIVSAYWDVDAIDLIYRRKPEETETIVCAIMSHEPINVDLAMHYLQYWPSDRMKFGVWGNLYDVFIRFSSRQVVVAVLRWSLQFSPEFEWTEHDGKVPLYPRLSQEPKTPEMDEKHQVDGVDFKETDRQRFAFVRELVKRNCIRHRQLLKFGERHLGVRDTMEQFINSLS
jgi:hypothetical protein